jgi:hypothetical protein
MAIQGLPSIVQRAETRHMQEAMGLVHAHAEKVEKSVCFETANLFDPEVDLIFYDTAAMTASG